MTVLEQLSHGISTRRLGTVARRIQDTDHADAQPLSVFLEGGVVPRSERTDNHNQLGSDLAKYQLVEPGDLVFNRLRTWQGGFGASRHRGIVSPAYIVARTDDSDARYLDYVLHSAPYLAELVRISKWMPPSQFDVLWADLRQVEIPWIPIDQQRRIAAFLDDRLARIDQIITSRMSQSVALGVHRSIQLVQTIVHEGDRLVPCRQFADIRLGRQRSPQHEFGDHMVRYLRSANVRDGAFNLADVKQMNFTPSEQRVFELQPGDVLVTEGSASAEAVGASATWSGELDGTVCFQNTLLRLRARPNCAPSFLSLWARASHASGAARELAGGASILHLGAEGMARLPMPDLSLDEQNARAAEASSLLASHERAMTALERSTRLVKEYKQSLITAAVTGELDVTTAGSGIPG